MPQVSFSADIKPLFRAVDISHMKRFGVELDSYTYMSNPENANKVLATLSPHGSWLTEDDFARHRGERVTAISLDYRGLEVIELPPIKPVVTAYQWHQLVCPSCGATTRAPWPAGVPSGTYGPRVQATVALYTGHIACPNARRSKRWRRCSACR